MILQGTTIYSKWGYKPKTLPSISFSKSSTGYFKTRDKGIAQDVYESSISIQDTWENVNAVLSTMNLNKEALTLSLGTGEEIFGADISAATCELISSTAVNRNSFNEYSVDLTLRAINPGFVYTSASFDPFRITNSYTSQTTESIQKKDSYTNAFSYVNPVKNTGVFNAEFIQTTAEMKTLRRHWLMNVRGNAFTLPTFGGVTDITSHTTYAFGPASGPGPFKVKIYKWEEVRNNFNEWTLKIQFVKDIPLFSAGSSTRNLSNVTFLQAGNGSRSINNFRLGQRNY